MAERLKIHDTLSNAWVDNGALRVALDQSTTSQDVFGRLRVSEPYTIFDGKLINGKQPLFYDEIVSGGTASSTHNTGEASVSMVVANDLDYVIRQTKMVFNYQPGKAQYILFTGVMGEPTANTESRIGYFNTFGASAPYTANRDGLYFGQDGTNKYVAISKNGTEKKIIQSDWNVDTLDGTGSASNPSGINANWDYNQIFFIDFEWLGVGIVRYGKIIDGHFKVCHIENHANMNIATGAYMATPNHSVRYEIYSTGGSLTMKQICASVMSEGGLQPSGVTRSFGNETTPVAVSTTLTGLLFMRVNANKPWTTIDLDSFGILNTANSTDNYHYKLILNPTVAGTALNWNNLNDSAIDFARGVSNNAITNGTEIYADYASGKSPNARISADLIIKPGIAIDGTQDVFAICIKTFAGTDTFVASANTRE